MNLKEFDKLYEDKKYVEAFMYIDSFLQLGPNNIDALKRKAVVLEKMGFYRNSFSVWDEVFDLDPYDKECIKNIVEYAFQDFFFMLYTRILENGIIFDRYLPIFKKIRSYMLFTFCFFTILFLANYINLFYYRSTYILLFISYAVCFLTKSRVVIDDTGVRLLSLFKRRTYLWKDNVFIYGNYGTKTGLLVEGADSVFIDVKTLPAYSNFLGNLHKYSSGNVFLTLF